MTNPAVYRNALQIHTVLMEYRLDAVLGAGGFGLTYLAWDGHLEKHVAIKEYLPAELAMRSLDGTIVPVTSNREYDYQWGLERFLQEARTLARFTHPHIVRVNRYFEANGTAYMVMDYEKGQPMSQLLKREPLLEEEKLRAILMPLLDGLRAVHEAGFLHRDIKPGNIFLREQGSPVLIDFGSARHALGGARDNYTAVVTPGYAPLEQYTADGRQGAWSDIYALSGVMFRAVTQHNPPDAVSRLRRDAVPQILAGARTHYTEHLLEAINWGLTMDDQRRPQSVAEWQTVLSGSVRAPLVLPVASAIDVMGEANDIATIMDRPGVSGGGARRAGKMKWLALDTAAVLTLIAGAAWQLGTEYVHAPQAQITPAAVETAKETSTSITPPPPSHVERAHGAVEHKPAHSAVKHKSAIATHARRNAIVLTPEQIETVGDEPLPQVADRGTEKPAEKVVENSSAPVRDAVLLPPLASAPYERPTRDRSPRPGDIH